MNDTDIQHSTTTPAAAHSPLEVLLIFLKLPATTTQLAEASGGEP